MLHKMKQRNEGFTIIEVMIVLAIAGLIMLVVFLAVPALQRSSHNTQRKNDVSSFAGAVQEWTDNNGGTGPSSTADVTAVVGNIKPGFYSTANFYYTTTPPAVPSSIGSGAGSATSVTTEDVILVKGVKCTSATGQPTTTGATSRNYSVVYAVETGGNGQYECQDI